MKKGLLRCFILLSTFLASAVFAQNNQPVPLIKPGVLTVCAYTHSEPMIFEDALGNPKGYEADILTIVAEKMNLQLEFKEQSVFKGIWQKPAAKKCDVVAAGLTALAEREKDGAAFTMPHFITNQSLLIRGSDKNIFHSIQDFAGKKIGVTPGTTMETQIKRVAPKSVVIVPFNYQTDRLIALANKKIDAVADDTATNAYYAKLNGELAVVALPPTHEKLAFAVDGNNKALLARLNEILRQMKKDGTLQKIYSQWFEGKINF